MNRTSMLQALGAVAVATVLPGVAPSYVCNGVGPLVPVPNGERIFDFVVDASPFAVDGRTGSAITINGGIPAPLLRAREGETAVIRVTNKLRESTSIHWHGVLIPNNMDGVPGVTFAGIGAGQTFTYRLPIKQSGTYWFHSHTGLQEQVGVYGPIVLDPADRDPVEYDREHVVMLSDWTFDNPMGLIAKLRKDAGYYNFSKLTASDYMKMAKADGRSPSLIDTSEWARMRMDPTDLTDVSAYTYTYLMNGVTPEANWTPLFKPGERVRLRVVGGAAMSTFDVRIPGLRMTIVQADGENVKPVKVDEFRIAPGETYDVIVQPTEDRAYTIFAESMDRTGYARGTLAPRPEMTAEIPARRQRALLSMNDMGMDMGSISGMSGMSGDMKGMDTRMQGSAKSEMPSRQIHSVPAPAMAGAASPMAGMDMKGTDISGAATQPAARPTAKPAPKRTGSMAGMSGMSAMSGMRMATPKPVAKATPKAPAPDTMAGMKMAAPTSSSSPSSPNANMKGMDMSGGASSMPTPGASNGAYLPGSPPVAHSADTHGVENTMIPMQETNRLREPGTGLENAGHRVLVYTDLQSLAPQTDRRAPAKTLELHLTGNMERYMWSFDGQKYSEAGAFQFRRGERVRMILVNDTMMEHPIHLHGMYMELENGAGANQPFKHTIRVKPAERLSVAITPELPGEWALHCHLLLHMEMGMMRVVQVTA